MNWNRNMRRPPQTKLTAIWTSVLIGMILGSAVPDARLRASERKAATVASDSAAVIDDFTLQGARGTSWNLKSNGGEKFTVVAFLGTECPLAKLYGPRLQKLATHYESRGVAFVGINSNTQDSTTEIVAFSNRHQISFPMLKDPGNQVADLFHAQRTPEVFVLDANRKIRYRGRIDDQYLVGLVREKPTRRDLELALDELLAGKHVTQPVTEAIGCHIGREITVEPHGTVTYSNQISRITNQRCLECHRAGEVAPFTLATYEDFLGWGDTILEVIEDQRMPPWFANPQHGQFSNDARLSEQEKDLIRTWIKNGMPEGDPRQLPEPPVFLDGWRMDQPDLIIKIPEVFEIPAQGVVEYQYYPLDPASVDPTWTEDRYIIASEARPQNRAVVHHIILYAIQERPDGKKDRQMLVGYAPGALPNIMPEGTAIRVPKGSKLLFEMHYTPNGSPQKDQSYVGLKFADKSEVKKIYRGGAVLNRDFKIKPHEAHAEVFAEHPIRKDQMLLSMTPHMHVRGKAFNYEAIFPDGTRRTLLDVPKYDFNWQLSYRLAEPVYLPKGTVIRCKAIFDNSEDNLVNPDPSKLVEWGEQSWEEMMIGFYSAVDATEADRRRAALQGAGE